MGEVTYILGIKISRNRNSKSYIINPYIPIYKGTTLSKSMCMKNDEDTNKMLKVPYTQAM